MVVILYNDLLAKELIFADKKIKSEPIPAV